MGDKFGIHRFAAYALNVFLQWIDPMIRSDSFPVKVVAIADGVMRTLTLIDGIVEVSLNE